MTVLVLERYPVDPSRIAAFEELATRRIARLRSAAGILWADLTCTQGWEETGDSQGFVILAEWRTTADADAWSAGEDPAEFDAVLAGEVTRRRFAPVPSSGRP